MGNRWLLLSCLIIAILVIIFQFYRLMDNGITLAHQSDQLARVTSSRTHLICLLQTELVGKKIENVIVSANKCGIEVIEKAPEGIVWIGDVQFVVSEGITKNIIAE